MPSLEQNDADSVVYHDAVEEILETPRDAAATADGTTVSPPFFTPSNDVMIEDVESCPFNDHSDDILNEPSSEPSSSGGGGSSVAEAVFNFTNSIVGAGCIGLGGAIALSGGFISVGLVLFFALLTKLSLDLLVRLSLEVRAQHGAPSRDKISYEDLAQLGMGWPGRILVMACKFSYAFGCLVAYVIVIKDNCGPALKSLIYGINHQTPTFSTEGFLTRLNMLFYHLLSEDAWFTWAIGLGLILPLCMLRDMTPLAFTSLVSVVSMIMIVAIVIYIYFDCPQVREPGGTFFENWIEIRPGVWDNLGTFVFTFVSQHTVHLVFASLKPQKQTLRNWKIVSSCSILAATTVSLLVGVFVYATFWQNTKSDIFQIYPESWMIDLAKLLLCITMIGTFPLPFFTCRELIIVTLIHPLCGIDWASDNVETINSRQQVHADYANDSENELRRPLVGGNSMDESNENGVGASDASSVDTELSRRIIHHARHTATPKNWLLPEDDRQLQWPGHVGVTFKLWLVATGFAIAAPSLGDILNLVGCASGTLIAFIIPALLSFCLEGYNHLAILIFCVGGVVGTFGTFCSVKQLVLDLTGR
jgi:amino acid permease